jgi:hypothetical protein
MWLTGPAHFTTQGHTILPIQTTALCHSTPHDTRRKWHNTRHTRRKTHHTCCARRKLTGRHTHHKSQSMTHAAHISARGPPQLWHVVASSTHIDAQYRQYSFRIKLLPSQAHHGTAQMLRSTQMQNCMQWVLCPEDCVPCVSLCFVCAICYMLCSMKQYVINTCVLPPAVCCCVCSAVCASRSHQHGAPAQQHTVEHYTVQQHTTQ